MRIHRRSKSSKIPPNLQIKKKKKSITTLSIRPGAYNVGERRPEYPCLLLLVAHSFPLPSTSSMSLAIVFPRSRRLRSRKSWGLVLVGRWVRSWIKGSGRELEQREWRADAAAGHDSGEKPASRWRGFQHLNEVKTRVRETVPFISSSLLTDRI